MPVCRLFVFTVMLPLDGAADVGLTEVAVNTSTFGCVMLVVHTAVQPCASVTVTV